MDIFPSVLWKYVFIFLFSLLYFVWLLIQLLLEFSDMSVSHFYKFLSTIQIIVYQLQKISSSFHFTKVINFTEHCDTFSFVSQDS